MKRILIALSFALALATFSAPESLAATPNTHYCGVKKLPVAESVKGVYNFRSACRFHDTCYRSAKNGERYKRAWCDDRFEERMMANCKTSKRKVRCRIAAEAYYYAVRGPLGVWAYRVLEPQVEERDLG